MGERYIVKSTFYHSSATFKKGEQFITLTDIRGVLTAWDNRTGLHDGNLRSEIHLITNEHIKSIALDKKKNKWWIDEGILLEHCELLLRPVIVNNVEYI